MGVEDGILVREGVRVMVTVDAGPVTLKRPEEIQTNPTKICTS
jgi:hypothetical protein